MKELIQYTGEFEFFDPEKPFIESEFNILITHDNSKELIGDKFIINFLNSEKENIAEMNINTWCIMNIIIYDYYGRAKIKVAIKDPKGTNLPAFESGGFSLSTDEESNIIKVKNELTLLLKKVRRFSFFLDYRSRLDYINLFKKEHPNQDVIY